MKTKFKHIYFHAGQHKKKTQVWHCVNNSKDEHLGDVKWNPGWRRYCFFTIDMGLILSPGCLKDITTFANTLMLQHKINRSNESQ